VGWALAHRAAGWAGLVAISAIVIALAHVLLYRFLVRSGCPALVAFVSVVLAAATAASHWLARPHLLTVLFLVVWTWILEDVVSGRSAPRRLALLPLSMVLWVNLHGGFLVGLGVLGCYVAGSFLGSRLWRPLALAWLASLAATLLNPYGYRLLVHLVGYFGAIRPQLAQNEEFAPAFIGDRAGAVLFVFLALALLALLVRGWALRTGRLESAPRMSAGALLAFCATTFLAITSIRNVEVMAILGAVVLANGIAPLFLILTRAERDDWERLREREARCGFGLTAIALAGTAVGALANAREAFDPARFPVGAVRALVEARVAPSGPIFSTAAWGGYLRLSWPGVGVFVDGRTDMYGDDFMRRWAEIYSAAPGWNTRLWEAGVDWVVLPVDAPLARAIDGNIFWSRYRTDAVAIVYRRLTPQGQAAPSSSRGVPPEPIPGLDCWPAAFTAVTRYENTVPDGGAAGSPPTHAGFGS
jgi:hypothetical protein